MENELTVIGSILSAMSDGVLVIGQDGRILLHNKAAEQILGLSEETLH